MSTFGQSMENTINFDKQQRLAFLRRRAHELMIQWREAPRDSEFFNVFLHDHLAMSIDEYARWTRERMDPEAEMALLERAYIRHRIRAAEGNL